MIFPALVPGIFIERSNRFTAQILLEDNARATSYVPTTGRLSGVLQKDTQVWLQYSNNPNRKTAYTLVLAELKHGGFCSVNAFMANQLFAEAINKGRLSAFPYSDVETEVTIEDSRLDFRLSHHNKICWVEVKSVTYVEDGVGKFPDAPTTRGKRHLNSLASRVAKGERASVVFVCQREDASSFAPYEEIDPAFAETLRQVQAAGVEIHAYRSKISLEKIEITEEINVLTLI